MGTVIMVKRIGSGGLADDHYGTIDGNLCALNANLPERVRGDD
jgi:hypothetical protein